MKKVFTFFFLSFLLLAPLNAQKSEKVSAQPETTVTMFQKGKTLQLQNATVGEKVQVLSIVGVRVFEKKIESVNQDFQLDLPKGYYIVKLGNVVRKISVK